jgi:predicted NAD/FAD-dependent oxidoreductase
MDLGIVKEWHGRIVAIDRGRLLPGQPQTRYVGVPAMNSIAKHLANSLEVTNQTRVISLTRRSEQWLLHNDAYQELGCYDALIIALPAPQAAELLSNLPEFAPPVRACQLAPCWAVMVAFETPLGLPFDGAYVNDSPLSWIARDSSKPGRPQAECWVLHASPAWSTEHLEQPAKTVCDKLVAALSSAVGIDDLRPIHAAAHRWRYALPFEPLSVGCLWEDAARIAVCGDWCHAGRIEGAFLSGLAAAERITMARGMRGSLAP